MSYNPSSLVCLKSKNYMWYVQVTKPLELQHGTHKQIRRSTGTPHLREAERRQHRITEQIYKEFDQEIERRKPQPKLTFTYLTDDPDPLYQYRPRPIIPKKNASLRLSRVAPRYRDERKWPRQKTRNAYISYIQEFIGVVGDLQIDEIKKRHAYEYARYLDQCCFSNSTVGTRVRAVGGMLSWCEKNGLIDDHSYRNIQLSDFGYPGRPYKPFPLEELKKIFGQVMPDQERHCMSLLATTGARLDEIALLTWDQIKSAGKIAYLDFTDAIIKTPGSQRLVPLHPRLALPPRSSGRLFTYPAGQDGKSQNNASRAMMPIIRSAVGEDDRKALHSFRGTFKDMLRDAGVSKELNDFITGHGQGDVAGGYGQGHSLEKRFEAISRIDVAFLGPEILTP